MFLSCLCWAAAEYNPPQNRYIVCPDTSFTAIGDKTGFDYEASYWNTVQMLTKPAGRAVVELWTDELCGWHRNSLTTSATPPAPAVPQTIAQQQDAALRSAWDAAGDTSDNTPAGLEATGSGELRPASSTSCEAHVPQPVLASESRSQLAPASSLGAQQAQLGQAPTDPSFAPEGRVAGHSAQVHATVEPPEHAAGLQQLNHPPPIPRIQHAEPEPRVPSVGVDEVAQLAKSKPKPKPKPKRNPADDGQPTDTGLTRPSSQPPPAIHNQPLAGSYPQQAAAQPIPSDGGMRLEDATESSPATLHVIREPAGTHPALIYRIEPAPMLLVGDTPEHVTIAGDHPLRRDSPCFVAPAVPIVEERRRRKRRDRDERDGMAVGTMSYPDGSGHSNEEPVDGGGAPQGPGRGGGTRRTSTRTRSTKNTVS